MISLATVPAGVGKQDIACAERDAHALPDRQSLMLLEVAIALLPQMEREAVVPVLSGGKPRRDWRLFNISADAARNRISRHWRPSEHPCSETGSMPSP